MESEMTTRSDNTTKYRALPFMRWEVDEKSQELVAQYTHVGYNAMMVIGDALRQGAHVEARTYLTDTYNMPHDGRLIMLLDAEIRRIEPAPLTTLPLGEIAF